LENKDFLFSKKNLQDINEQNELVEFLEDHTVIVNLDDKLPKINTKIEKKEFCTKQVLIKNKKPKKKKKNQSINSIVAMLQTGVINNNFPNFFTLLKKHKEKLDKENKFSLSTLLVRDKENFLKFVEESNLAASKDDYTNLLHLLIQKKALPELIEWAIGKGADIDALDSQGVPPAQRALSSYDIFSFLLRFNPDLNKLNAYGVSTFHEVLLTLIPEADEIYKEKVRDFANYLIRNNKADVNRPLSLDAATISPLAYAIRCGRDQAISFILENKGEFFFQEYKDKKMSSEWQNHQALHFVAAKSAPEIIELLVKTKRWGINEIINGRTPLHEALLAKKLENVEKLINLGADTSINIKIRNHEYTTEELMRALCRNQIIELGSKNKL
jgi:ankyrin repeat protein